MKMANYYNRMFLLSPYKYSYKYKNPVGGLRICGNLLRGCLYLISWQRAAG